MKQICVAGKEKNIIKACVALLVACIVFAIPIAYTDSLDFPNWEQLDTGWNVYLNDQYYENATISQLQFKSTNKGDVMILSKVLDSEKKISKPMLRCFSIHSVVKVYLDNIEIYNYGQDRYDEGKMLGYGYQYIPLPDNYNGKQLRVEFLVTENDAFTGIQAMEIGDGNTLMRRSMVVDRYKFAVSLFLILAGLMISVASAVMMISGKGFAKLYAIGMFAGLMGCWTMCNCDLITYFTQDLLVKVYLEYLSIYSLPIPFLLYFYDRVNDEDTNVYFIIFYWITLFTQVSFLIIAIVGQAMNLIHLPEMLRFDHFLLAVDLVLVIGIAFMDMKRHRKFSRITQIGVVCVFIFCIVELIRYNLEKYVIGFSANRYSSSLCFGALLIVFAMIADYTSGIKNMLYKDAQQQLLERMAYSDELTGLGNRRKCDEAIAKFLSEDQNFAFISMDLNRLKYYNDTFGHEKGDALLKAFAKVLQYTFPEPAICCRNGGDEFTVILPEKVLESKDAILERLNKNIAYANQMDQTLLLSTAVGIVYRSEFAKGVDYHILSQKVDLLMYENKRSMKEKERAATGNTN